MNIVIIMVLREVNFATSKNLVLKSTMFLHININHYSWISSDVKNHNQIPYILIESRWLSSIIMSSHSGELTVIVITVWCLGKLGKFCD